jgi:hypothetical protein
MNKTLKTLFVVASIALTGMANAHTATNQQAATCWGNARAMYYDRQDSKTAMDMEVFITTNFFTIDPEFHRTMEYAQKRPATPEARQKMMNYCKNGLGLK